MNWKPFTLAFCAACASPREATTHIQDAEAAVSARVPEFALVERALELADLDALGLAAPTAAELADSTTDGYWHGAAYAFAPPVREARARALAALAREGAAGAPGPVQVRAVDHEFGGDDVLIESVASFDLIGLLGLGPSAAARQVARGESLAALSALELALWTARFEVDLQRVDLAASYRRAERSRALLEEAREDLPRVEILEGHGRLGTAAADAARGQVEAVRVALGRDLHAIPIGRARVAVAVGLPLEQVDDPGPMALERALDDEPLLCLDHPALRSRRVELALTEARLRAVAARAWPGIQAGPHLGFPGGDLDPLRVGGLFALSLPFPSSYEGPLEAAAVERDRSVERYEETWLELGTRLEAARKRYAISRARLEAARAVDTASEGAWSAARAAFRVGKVGVAEWNDALERRRDAVNLAVEAARDAARAALEAQRAAGPQGGVR